MHLDEVNMWQLEVQYVNDDDAFSRNVINKVDGFAGEESLSSMVYLLQAMFVEMDSHANKSVFFHVMFFLRIDKVCNICDTHAFLPVLGTIIDRKEIDKIFF